MALKFRINSLKHAAVALTLLLGACGDDSGTPDADAGPSDSAMGTDSALPGDGGPTDGGPMADSGPAPGTWQLPAGHFTPARMPMTLVHPRDASTPSWVYAKNAHPGVHWEIPIVVQGGAWPFRYTIVNDGGATGLTIGGELVRTDDAGFVVHRVTPDYGVLSWANPLAGNYTIVLRVDDQDGNTMNVPVSLTVGTAGWVFIDADAGDDTVGDGSIGAPFETLVGMHDRDDTSTLFANHRVYLAGTVPMDGNRPNGNLRIDPGNTPSVWLGLPGRSAVLEAYEGKFVVASPDFYLANIEHRHRVDYVPDDGSFIHMFTVWDAPRFTLHDVTFSRFQGVPVNVGLGNSAVMMFTRGADRPHVAVVNCTITGPSGVFTSTYSLRDSVFEKNRWVDADLSLSDGSVNAIIYSKGDNENITIRANEMVENLTWTGLTGIQVHEARLIEIAHNVIETPYDSGRAGSIRLFVNSPAAGYSWTTDTPVWVDRNSLRRRLRWEGDSLADMPDGVVHIDHNVVSPESIPVHTRIVATDNLADADHLDAEMRLTGASRADYLGQRGAEVAAPGG